MGLKSFVSHLREKMEDPRCMWEVLSLESKVRWRDVLGGRGNAGSDGWPGVVNRGGWSGVRDGSRNPEPSPKPSPCPRKKSKITFVLS